MRHGLALSGGGANGSFEAGAAAAIVEHYQHTDSPITTISGTSVGALNAAGILHGGPRYPMELWWDVSKDDVYRSSKVLVLWRVIRKSAIYDSTPLFNLVERVLDPKLIAASEVDLFVHTTDVLAGLPVVFTGKHPDLLTAIYASASIPGTFPPVAWNGRWLVDGGTIDNSPVRSLIRAGCDKITVIYLDDQLPSKPTMASTLRPGELPDRPSIHGIVGPTIKAMMGAHFQRDLKNVALINDLVRCEGDHDGHRTIDLSIFRPEDDLGDSLDFDTYRLRVLMDRGYHQALAWLGGRSA